MPLPMVTSLWNHSQVVISVIVLMVLIQPTELEIKTPFSSVLMCEKPLINIKLQHFNAVWNAIQAMLQNGSHSSLA